MLALTLLFVSDYNTNNLNGLSADTDLAADIFAIPTFYGIWLFCHVSALHCSEWVGPRVLRTGWGSSLSDNVKHLCESQGKLWIIKGGDRAVEDERGPYLDTLFYFCFQFGSSINEQLLSVFFTFSLLKFFKKFVVSPPPPSRCQGVHLNLFQ